MDRDYRVYCAFSVAKRRLHLEIDVLAIRRLYTRYSSANEHLDDFKRTETIFASRLAETNIFSPRMAARVDDSRNY